MIVLTIAELINKVGFQVDQKSVGNVNSAVNNLKGFATKALGAIGITFSIAGIKKAIDSCVEIASSVEEMENKFNTVFDGINDEVDAWAQNYADAIGRNKNDIKTYLADQENLLVGFGMTREAGAELSEQMTSLALDLASFGNMNEASAVNYMTKAVMGESEAAKSLGAVLNDSTRAQAMATLGLSGTYDKLDQLTKMQVNYQAILSQSPDAIGDCERSMNSYESTTRRFQARIKEIQTLVGQFFLPTYQKVLSLGARGLTLIRNWIQWLGRIMDQLGGAERVIPVLGVALAGVFALLSISKLQAIAASIKKIADNFGLLNKKVGLLFIVFLALALLVDDFIAFMNGDNSLMGAMLERAGVDCDKLREDIIGAWEQIKEAVGYIAEGIKNVVIPIFEGIRDGISTAFDVIQEKVNQVAPGIAQFFDELSSGKVDKKKWTEIGESIGRIAVGVIAVISAIKSISTVIGIVAGVVSAFKALVLIIKAVWSFIKVILVLVKSAIVVGKVILSVIGIVGGAFGPVIVAILAVIAVVVLLVYYWDTIKEKAVEIWNAVVEAFTGLRDGVNAKITEIWKTIVETFTSIRDSVTAKAAEIWKAVVEAFTGLCDGVHSRVTDIYNTIVAGFQKAIDWITSLPSKAVQWGADIINGIVSGIRSGIDKIGDAASGIAGKISSFLHFSVPDEGPLKDFDTSMPDMISLMEKGIRGGKGRIQNAVKELSADMSVVVKSGKANPVTVGSSVSNNSRTVNQTVSITNTFHGDRAGQQKSAAAMKKASGDVTESLARGLAYAR